jgi:hypothetical protein
LANAFFTHNKRKRVVRERLFPSGDPHLSSVAGVKDPSDDQFGW